MDLGTVMAWLPAAIGVVIVIVIALLVIRVAQHYYHRGRTRIEQEKVDRTKRMYFPW
ncbi:MAG TPA: hypothetical protein VFZ63_15685 [Jiangellaceae bacterium]